MKVALGNDVYGYVNAYYVGYDTYYATAETLDEEQARLDQQWTDYLAQQKAEEDRQNQQWQEYLDTQAAQESAAAASYEEQSYEAPQTEAVSYDAGSDAQAQAIVDMRLRTLTGLEREKLEAEYQELLKKIEEKGVKQVDLDTLLENSDIVSIHVRLSDETRGMFGREQFAKMKPTAILINTARAGLVDYDALTEALQTGKIRGAGLDVYVDEGGHGLDPANPLLALDNVTMMPHCGGQFFGMLELSCSMLITTLVKWLETN